MSNLIKVGGGVVFWSLARWHGRDRFKAELASLDLDKFVPPARGPLQALRDSLHEVYPRHQIEYTLGKKHYQVDRIIRKDDEVLYEKVALASVDAQGGITLEPFDYEIAARITESFNRHLGLVTGESVANTLIRYCEHLGGTRLRPVAGIYWLPDDKLPAWQLMTDLVQRSAIGTSVCYLIRHQMDADAVRAVRDAICAEIKATAANLKKEIQSGELSEKQLAHRHEQAEEVRARINLYEELLGMALDHLRDALDAAEQASATAGILGAVAGGLEELDVPA